MKRHLMAATLLLAAGASQAYVLDFGAAGQANCTPSSDGLGAPLGCNDLRYILQSYGDVAGVVDVNYSAPRISTSLTWFSSGFNDLYGVLYAEGGDTNSQGRIDIKPLDGGAVTLTHFDLGAFYYSTIHTTVNVFEIGSSTPLFTYSGNVGSVLEHSSFDVSASSTKGLRLEWQDSAYNVGIDNVTFTVSAVPEPSTYAMLLAGLAVCSAVARKRRA